MMCQAKEPRPHFKGQGHPCCFNVNMHLFMWKLYFPYNVRISKFFGTYMLHMKAMCCTKEPRP